MKTEKFRNQKSIQVVNVRKAYTTGQGLGSPSSRFWSSPIKTDTLRVRPKLTAGFTLIETFTAIIILLIAILGPLTLLSRAISDGIYAQNKITASFLLQEGLDLSISHWEKLTEGHFVDLSGADINICSSIDSACYVSVDVSGNVSFIDTDDYSICLVENSSSTENPPQYFYGQTSSGCGAGLDTIFTRKIWFKDILAIGDEIDLFGTQIGKVAYVQVTWTYKGLERTAESKTILLK